MRQRVGRNGLWRGRTPAPRPVAQGGNAPGRLEGDLRGHLRLPEPALAEADRHLDDLEAQQQRAVGELDLERVALRARRARVDALQGRGAKALEATGQVADLHAEHA